MIARVFAIISLIFFAPLQARAQCGDGEGDLYAHGYHTANDERTKNYLSGLRQILVSLTWHDPAWNYGYSKYDFRYHSEKHEDYGQRLKLEEIRRIFHPRGSKYAKDESLKIDIANSLREKLFDSITRQAPVESIIRLGKGSTFRDMSEKLKIHIHFGHVIRKAGDGSDVVMGALFPSLNDDLSMFKCLRVRTSVRGLPSQAVLRMRLAPPNCGLVL